MRQIVSLEKEIVFKTMIGEICSISLEHDLSFINESEIEGNLIISGTYKMTEASTLEEEFNYKIPVEIMLTTNLLEDKRKIDINDFTYKIINEEALNIKVEILIEGLEKVDVTDIMEKDSEIESVVLEKEPLKDEVKEECSVRESKDLEVIDTPKERKDEGLDEITDPFMASSIIYLSLAEYYDKEIKEIENALSRSFGKIAFVGGSSKDLYLAMLIALKTRKEVIATSSDSALMGNVLFQMITIGELELDRKDDVLLRAIGRSIYRTM